MNTFKPANYSSLSALSVAALIASGVPAFAQETSDEDTARLSTVTVVAQRTEQNLQDVPIAVVAVSAETLDKTNVNNSIDFAQRITGLEINASNGSATTFLRGVGTDNTVIGAESPIAYYVDGVYLASPAAALFSLNNVASVEVLKGPQGTLFGRNASGGVIQIITRDPEEAFSGEASIGYGNFETLDGSLYLTTGVTDRLATDLAVAFRDQGEGYGFNATTNEDVYKDESFAIRNKWFFDGDQTDVRFSLAATETDTDFGTLTVPIAGSILLGGETNQGPLTFFNGNEDPGAKIDTFSADLRINHSFGDLDFVSITAFQQVDSEFIASADNSAAALLSIDTVSSNETFSQEFQLLGAGDTYNWIAGLYYFDNEAGYDTFDTLVRSPAGVATVSEITAFQDTKSYAIYGQFTKDITEAFRITTGLRYTLDEREFSGENIVPTPAGPLTLTVPDSNNSTDDDAFTWRLSADYDLSENILGYVSYNRGFKSGQFAVNEFATLPVDSEILDAYEIGIKSELFDNRLRLNAAAYYYDYQDLQAQVVSGTTPVIVNAGDAVIQGIDLDFEASLSSSFSVFGGLSILDSESQDFPNPPSFIQNDPTAPAPNGIVLPFGPGGSLLQVGAPGSGSIPGTLANAEGNALPQASELSATFGGSYVIETASNGTFDFNANVSYNDGYFFEFENRTEQGSYSVLGASINWTSPSEVFGITLWGSNLTDEEYLTGGTSFSFGDFGFPAAPQTYGIRLNSKF